MQRRRFEADKYLVIYADGIEAGMKGKREGGAGISVLHSNFIVNLGGATSGDVLALAGMIRETVEKMSGIVLEEEVEIVPENPAAIK